MQDQKIKSHSNTRKPWYERAIEMATQWKTISKPPGPQVPTMYSKLSKKKGTRFSTTPNGSLWKTSTCRSSATVPIARTSSPPEGSGSGSGSGSGKLRKSASLRVAASFTRACLCAPISSYNNNEVFRGDVMPRRSYSYPRSSNPLIPTSILQETTTVPSARLSTEGRKIFRGKSLRDDVLMKRFVLEEETMMMRIRRSNEMEIIRRRRSMMLRRKQIGPSRLSRMSLATTTPPLLDGISQ